MMPHIVIRQTMGTLSIDSTPAQFSPTTRKLQLNMKQARSDMQMHTTQAKINIDQTEAFASAGDKKPIRMADDFNKQSLQKGLQAISNITNESLQFLRIERGGNPIASMARQSGTHDVQLTLKTMPSARPEISVNPGSVNISFSQSPLQTDWEWIDNKGEYTPHSVKITWGTRPSIEISVEPGVELKFPVTSVAGVAVDEAI